MKLLLLLIAVVVAAVMLTGCLYTHVTLPYSTDLNNTDLGHKKGEASLQSVLWLFAWGDAGQAAAAKNGGINTLKLMDRESYVIFFGIYSRQTTIVYGD